MFVIRRMPGNDEVASRGRKKVFDHEDVLVNFGSGRFSGGDEILITTIKSEVQKVAVLIDIAGAEFQKKIAKILEQGSDEEKASGVRDVARTLLLEEVKKNPALIFSAIDEASELAKKEAREELAQKMVPSLLSLLKTFAGKNEKTPDKTPPSQANT